MAQQVPAARPEDRSWMSGQHTVEREKASSDLSTRSGHMCTRTSIHTKINTTANLQSHLYRITLGTFSCSEIIRDTKQILEALLRLDEIQRKATQTVTETLRVCFHIHDAASPGNGRFRKKFISHFYTNIHRYFLIMK